LYNIPETNDFQNNLQNDKLTIFMQENIPGNRGF